MTQSEVATSIHIDRSYYSQIESGIRNPSPEVSRNISKLFRIHSSLLLTDTNAFQDVFTQTQCVLAHSDLNLRYTWIFDPDDQEKAYQFLGAKDDEISYCIDAQKILALKQKVMDTQIKSATVVAYEHNNKIQTHYVVGYPLFEESGELIGVGTLSMKLDDEFSSLSI
jgi:transcriptional regulator with XRE-family HTH domain